MTGLTALAVGLICLLASWFATKALLPLLRQGRVLDRPTARSSHAQPTPRGGGLAVMAVVLLAWTGLGLAVGGTGSAIWPVLVAATGLSAVSFLDDMAGLPIPGRLAAQLVAIGLGVAFLPLPTGTALPPLVAGLLLGLLWLWFVNLYNFMDGIDGLAGVETASLGLGVATVSLLAGLGLTLAGAGAALAGAALGFLYWNWAPARLFLGDVGSIGLGYLAGFLLLHLALAGLWAIALMLPLYYLADASITLVRRLLLGEAFWRPHRQHYYQRAAAALGAHAPVSRTVLVANLTLLSIALLVLMFPGTEWLGLALGGATVAIVLTYFARLDQAVRRA